ncbi:unnamed protein product [Mytilus coruscus]|uniref:SAND domain-containing protein n=1 Tax=Mytilus coruscus TaxID=42192 RepID=A0A6J8DGR2_MYTCO|nr:unnamed protein product [Mytilus coruscus]
MEDSDTDDTKALDQDEVQTNEAEGTPEAPAGPGERMGNGNAGNEGPDTPGSLCQGYETDEGHQGESDLIQNTPMTTQIKQEVIDDDLQYETTEYDPTEDMSHEDFLSQEDRDHKLKFGFRHEASVLKSSKRISPTANNKARRRSRKDKLLDTNSEETDPADTIRVTCGHLTGLLHKELFYCPGIHRACLELDDGTFVTPKRFMFMGEKARLKDWKNAIRWNGHQLR